MEIKRLLDFSLPSGKSAFLWGPRKTGKSSYLRANFPRSIVYDFLKSDTFFEFSKRPFLLREQLEAKTADELRNPVILDEVQKVPEVLDEVQWLIENRKLSFILCGSSARKLKRGHGNLLGGRAWRYEMFPLTTAELGDLDLLKALNHGLVPAHYLEGNTYRRSLQSYTQDYLKEEIFAEGLSRNVPAFSRFLDAVGYGHGELINYANIARECGVDAKTIKEYYQILIDTLLGSFVAPFKRRQSRDVIGKASKFYLFDVGVAGFLSKRVVEEERGELFGRAFEHFIYMEMLAYRSYKSCSFDIEFWRTKSGLEVDFVLGNGQVAVEVKGSSRVDNRDLRSLEAFREEHKPRHAYVVCTEAATRIHGGVTIIPWREFLHKLWNGKVIC